MNRFLILFAVLLFNTALFAQSNTGELRLSVRDSSGLGVKASVELVCEANEFRAVFATDDSGNLVAKHLSFGVYRIQIHNDGFAPFSDSIQIRSAVPAAYTAKLSLSSPNTSIVVSDSDTLIDPYRTGDINRIGSEAIQDRPTPLPGRSLQDLVNSQPGWLYEGNAVLHPRGSEYQTQFVVDGFPLTDNRSPGFGPEIEADDVQSMSVYTANIPAEYGRKMGGVVEVNTARDTRDGLHGEVVLSGGSFNTGGAFASAQYVWGKNTLGISASGDTTEHYLNPVVPQNFTNTGASGGFSISYERDLTPKDRIRLSVRHAFSRYEIPNELIQQAAGQLQNGGNAETMGLVSYQHIFSSDVVGDFRGMVRDTANDLSSNSLSTPVIAFQNNYFREGYFKGSISVHHGRQEWKAGVESDSLFLHENFSDIIADFTRFDPATPATFSFAGNRPDLEQSAFVQDQIRLGKWTFSAGLRWDRYRLLVNQNAVSPRLGVARYFPGLDLVLHASYDRIFETPSADNILLSSSSQVISLSPEVLRLPVEPSHGNYYEVGLTKGFWGRVKLDGNIFDRRVDNFADDDQLLSTAVGFPIAFARASIYGADAKVEIPHWGRLGGFIGYSYMVASAYLPATGGLFLGDDATQALSDSSGRFWVSQDQRNTLRSRWRYEFTERLWAAIGGEYGSGLPVEFDGTPQDALQQSGAAVVDRINFSRGRVKPNLSVDASVGAELWRHENVRMRLQADVQNLTNRLNVIDFAGLFSGNAIGPSRSYFLRLATLF